MNLNDLGAIPDFLLSRLDVGWTFVLLLARYVAFFAVVPGIGAGFTGVAVRYPAAAVLSFAASMSFTPVPVPPDMLTMGVQLMCEVLLGGLVGIIPILIVSGAQTAGHIASGTMGLNGAQLVDPTTQSPMPDLARLYGDLSVLVFLLLGGHYVAIYHLSGVDSALRPGTFLISESGLQALISQSADIFQIGCMIAAPVIVALLLTNFVMAVISKAVPTVNIFIVSFPLTIAVGLGISILALPEVMHYLGRKFMDIEQLIGLVIT